MTDDMDRLVDQVLLHNELVMMANGALARFEQWRLEDLVRPNGEPGMSTEKGS